MQVFESERENRVSGRGGSSQEYIKQSKSLLRIVRKFGKDFLGNVDHFQFELSIQDAIALCGVEVHR